MATVQCFFLAMAINPEVQRRAQEELDNIVGKTRLPTFDDMQSLPYIRAIVKECLRWAPSSPLAIPHLSLEDDVYKGYFIPKGTVLLTNIW